MVATLALGLSALLLAMSGGITYLGHAYRGTDGYYMGRPETMASNAFAIDSEDMLIDEATPHSTLLESIVGDTKVRVRSLDDHPIFVGIASRRAARDFVAAVREGGRAAPPQERASALRAATVTPPFAKDDIWLARSSGTGTRSVIWPPAPGDWTVVIMNADGARGVKVDVAVGLTAPILSALLPWLLLFAGITAAAGVIALALRPKSAGAVSTQNRAHPAKPQPH